MKAYEILRLMLQTIGKSDENQLRYKRFTSKIKRDRTHSIVVIWVNIFQTKSIIEIYSTSL